MIGHRIYPFLFALFNFGCFTALQGQSVAADFTASDTVGCAPLQINFTSTSTNAVSYFWDFGNGGTSVLPNPTMTFTTPGFYTVTLIAIDGQLNADTLIRLNHIEVVANPVADFTLTTTGNCVNSNTLNCTNLSSGATSFLWDFGDGNSSTAASPTHHYASAGSYTVTLIALHALGCNDMHQMTQAAIIDPAPTSAFTVADTLVCDSGQSVVFTNLTAGTALQWLWAFGDGTSSAAQHPSHSFGSQGDFDVQLVTTNAFGCADTLLQNDYMHVSHRPEVNFTASATSGCEPFDVAFASTAQSAINRSWNFSNGLTGAGDSALTTFDSAGFYSVKLMAENEAGCADSLLVQNMIQVFPKPSALPAASDSVVCANDTLQFINLSTGAQSYQWDFDDGTISHLPGPVHAFSTQDQFAVMLTATSANGCKDSAVLSIEVPAASATFTSNKSSGCTPLEATFTASSPDAVQWFWNFGDGGTSTLQNPMHSYTNSGQFDVKLAVQDSKGCWDTVFAPGIISAVDSVYDGNIIDTIMSCAPMPLDLSNNSLGYGSWHWDFGNGDSSVVQSPTTTFHNSGVYTVKLKTMTPSGCHLFVDEYATFVLDEVDPDMEVLVFDCTNRGVQLSDSTAGAISWFWSFGDNSTSNLQSPTHIYADTGTYDVHLSVTTASGCVASKIFKAYLDFENCLVAGGPPPAGSLGTMTGGGNSTPSAQPPVFCAPQLVSFFSPVAGATAWLWDFGDGSGSASEHPNHLYAVPGQYTVTLIAQTSLGPDTLIWPNYVQVTGPTANFLLQENTGCDSVEVQFQNTSVSCFQHNWSFGDGSNSLLYSPVHTYVLNNALYPVQLHVSDTNGCGDDKMRFLHTAQNVLSFTFDKAHCLGDTVTFVPSDTINYSFVWDFGDGSSSTANTPSHSYGSSESYLVSVTATSLSGCVSYHVLDSVTVSGLSADFTILGTNQGCIGDAFSMEPIDTTGDSYHWRVGSQWIHNIMLATVELNDTGTYDVLLQVEKNGCTTEQASNGALQAFSPMADFSVAALNQCSPYSVLISDQSYSAVSWSWSADSVSIPGDSVLSYSYVNDTVLLGLTATDVHGCSDSSYVLYSIPPLTVEFSWSSPEGCAPWAVDFTNQSSTATSWLWDFGDGSSSTAQHPSHTFTGADTFDVSLTAFGTGGCQEVFVMPDLVKTSAIQAQFTMDSNTSCAPMVVNFSGLSVNAVDWNWSFGDSSFASIAAPSHIYTVPGDYNVSLSVANSMGCTDSVTLSSAVKVPGPIAHFQLQDSVACDSAWVEFHDSSSNASSWTWFFGDGNFSNLQHPSHKFGSPGNNVVTLTVQDSMGCSSSMTSNDTLTVVAGPSLSLSVTDTVGCVPLAVGLNASASNTSSLLWEFGNGDTASQNLSAYSYDSAGTFELQLSALNSFGCTDTVRVRSIRAIHQPSAAIAPVGPFCTNEKPFEMQAADRGGNWSGVGITIDSNRFDPTTAGAGTHVITYSIQGECPTSDTLKVEVFDSPLADFMADRTEFCGEGLVQFSALPMIQPSHSYAWLIDNEQQVFGPEPSIVLGTGKHTVSLTVKTEEGCLERTSKRSFVTVHDTVTPVVFIDRVTVEDDHSRKLEWQATQVNDIDGFAIYRSKAGDGNFRMIDSLKLNTSRSYRDETVKTVDSIYCYKVVAQSMCATNAALHSTTAHCPMNLTVSSKNAHSNAIHWSAYAGAEPDSVLVFKSMNHMKPVIIARLGADVDSFIDSLAYCSGDYTYRVQALALNSGAHSSMSDQEALSHTGVESQLTTDLSRVTVIDNSHTLLEWKKPVGAEKVLVGYEIFRSLDSSSYASIGQVPAELQTFSDLKARVDDDSYFYKIGVINSCSSALVLSNEGTSILLEAAPTNETEGMLYWTPYSGWKNGVKHYKIQRLNEQNEWETIEVVDSESTEVKVDF